MTCIIGIKTKDGVYIGGDRLACGKHSGQKYGRKVFNKKDRFIYGCGGEVRPGQILQYNFEEPRDYKDESVEDYLFKRYVKEMVSTFEKNNHLEDNDGISSLGNFACIMGYRGRLFVIYHDFAIFEPEESFVTIGSGDSHSEAVLLLLKEDKGMSPREKIKKAIDITSERIWSVDNNVDIEFLENEKDAEDGKMEGEKYYQTKGIKGN